MRKWAIYNSQMTHLGFVTHTSADNKGYNEVLEYAISEADTSSFRQAETRLDSCKPAFQQAIGCLYQH